MPALLTQDSMSTAMPGDCRFWCSAALLPVCVLVGWGVRFMIISLVVVKLWQDACRYGDTNKH